MIDTAVLMCHAPIVIPAIGGARAAQCERTTWAMRRAARCLVEASPDVLVVISPHAPRNGERWGVDWSPIIEGNFADFGVASLGLRIPGAPAAAGAVVESAQRIGLPTSPLLSSPLDHGASVPLYFLVEAGWRGPTLRIALPMPSASSEAEFGECLASAANALGQRWAILASGDMSHRLIPDAPAGFHPDAGKFDAAFVQALKDRDYAHACAPDPVLRELAAEDVISSVRVACAATNNDSFGAEFLSYEGPFGVGYAEAVLTDRSRPPVALLEVARDSIREAVSSEPSRVAPNAPTLPEPWGDARAVFVTLRRPNGELRGCIGQLAPTHDDLISEVRHCAKGAATSDPRFPAVSPEEMDGLHIEVSVLDQPRRVASRGELDPHRYGVVVRSGQRRGVLLPNVEGVETVEQQLRIACDKAGIGPQDEFEVERFLVRKVAQ